MFKARQNTPAEAAPVTRSEFDAFKRVVALAFMAAEESARHPGISGAIGSPHLRLGAIAAVGAKQFGLDAADMQELRGLLAMLEEARNGERQREFEAEQWLNRPRCADDYMPGGRFSPRG